MAGTRQDHRPALECQICHRTYSKAEHLQRHERTHTGSKPFACLTCGRHFSRVDSLTRHQRTHNRTQGHRQSSSWPSPSGNSGYGSLQSSSHQSDNAFQTAIDGSSIAVGAAFTDPDLNDLNIALEWPDSEALLQSIVSSDWNSLALPPGCMPLEDSQLQPQLSTLYEDEQIAANAVHDADQLSPPNGSHEAIQSLSDMITCLSQNVTSAVEALPGLTSVFLDNSLQAYFTHFNAHFPILHRPTFVFRECSPSLILNAIALGSLYIGTADAVAKGEVLWRLAHTAVATSWQVLIHYQGSLDSHKGVQLVLTALLGQCYAMMSRNENIRLTSQVFHSLGFNWANQCNMFALPPFENQSLVDGQDLGYKWKLWAAREIHNRALLGHYILDGQLSHLSGQPTSTVHATNDFGFTVSARVFDAQSAEEWQEAMKEESRNNFSFNEVYYRLFSKSDLDKDCNECLRQVSTPFDVRVILECLHALVRENRASDVSKAIIRIPSIPHIKETLAKVHELLDRVWPLDHVERLELMLHWHFICIDTLINSNKLGDQICQRLGIDQKIFKTRKEDRSSDECLSWTRDSADMRSAFLHAAAIQDILSQLPLNRTQSFWMPVPIFTVSLIFGTFRLNGIPSISVPPAIHWRSTLQTDDEAEQEQLKDDQAWRKTKSFLASDSRSASYNLGPLRNIPFDLKKLQTMLHGLTIQWGVSSEMEHIVSRFEIAECVPG